MIKELITPPANVTKGSSFAMVLSSNVSFRDTYFELIFIDQAGQEISVGILDPWGEETRNIELLSDKVIKVCARENYLTKGKVNYKLHTRVKNECFEGGFRDTYSEVGVSGITIIE